MKHAATRTSSKTDALAHSLSRVSRLAESCLGRDTSSAQRSHDAIVLRLRGAEKEVCNPASVCTSEHGVSVRSWYSFIPSTSISFPQLSFPPVIRINPL